MRNARQWMQMDLGNNARVTGLATQGRRDAHQWVTRYVVSYGDGVTFRAYRERRKIRVSKTFVWFGEKKQKIGKLEKCFHFVKIQNKSCMMLSYKLEGTPVFPSPTRPHKF